MLRFIRQFGRTAPNPIGGRSSRWGGASQDAELAIVARNLDMVYCSEMQPFQALKSVNFRVRRGDLQMVVGPSGAGKTTLLLILAGLLTPTHGYVQLLGHDITQMPRTQLDQFRLHNVGILFQESNLLRSLTALENVEAVLKIRGIHGPTAHREAFDLLKAVGLGDRTHHLPRQLSGGQQQRVAIARSLAGNPPIIIADEPTAALDSKNGRTMIEIMRRLAKEKGCTVLVATHDPRILDMADRVAHLSDGVLSEDFDWSSIGNVGLKTTSS